MENVCTDQHKCNANDKWGMWEGKRACAPHITRFQMSRERSYTDWMYWSCVLQKSQNFSMNHRVSSRLQQSKNVFPTHPTSSNLHPSSFLSPTYHTLQHEQSPPHPPHFLAVALETAGAPQHDVQCQQTDALKGLHHLALGHCRPLVLKHEPTPHTPLDRSSSIIAPNPFHR